MDIEKDSLKKQIREMTQLGYIAPEDLPSIELYMDQVTTFMDKYLSQNKRYEEDKTLTKTMINNYTKNNLLPPPEKKRYTKEHLILLIYIYYLKNVISISDIQIMLKPLIDHYFENPDAPHSLEEIYASLYKLEQRQHFRVENSIMKTFELSERDFPGADDQYIKNLNFLSLLGYDIYMKKKIMERIIDEMAAEQAKEQEQTNGKEKKIKEENKRKNKKETRRQLRLVSFVGWFCRKKCESHAFDTVSVHFGYLKVGTFTMSFFTGGWNLI